MEYELEFLQVYKPYGWRVTAWWVDHTGERTGSYDIIIDVTVDRVSKVLDLSSFVVDKLHKSSRGFERGV